MLSSHVSWKWLLALLLLTLALPLAALAQNGALVTLQPPAAEAPAADGTFATDVLISDASLVLGFQFDINFDPALLEVKSVDLGEFIGSTGRRAQPLGPDQRNAAEGQVVYGGFTIGDQEGGGGDGLLATIHWQVKQPGPATVSLGGLQLAGSGGASLPGAVGDALELDLSTSAAGETAGEATDAAQADDAGQQNMVLVWVILSLIILVVVILLVVFVFRR